MPLLAFALLSFMAAMAFVIDLSRDFLASDQLFHAARSAALFGLSCATNSDGSYNPAIAQGNISTNVLAAANLNQAPCGPATAGAPWQAPVSFDQSDILFSGNPQDPGEIVLRVRAKRTTADAIKAFFIPAVFAGFAQNASNSVQSLTLHRWCEVIGQPASRAGAGVLAGSASDAISASYAGFAALPVAISNAEFASAALSSTPLPSYVLDFVPSTSSAFGSIPASGHMSAALVNLALSGGASPYYAAASGNPSINQLEGQLNYFLPIPASSVTPPCSVERGSIIAAFDPADPILQSRWTEISQIFRNLPLNQDYIVPVVGADPAYSAGNTVVGFARLKLLAVRSSSLNAFSLTVALDESVPVRNTSCGSTLSSIPGQGLMPTAVPPFTGRTATSSGGITPRPLGVVMSACVSPRRIGF